MIAEPLAQPNQKRKIYLAVGLFVLAIGVLCYSFSGGPRARPPAEAKAFYTVDDGATWFEDRADLVAPFDHAGKQAVEVQLFAADGGKTTVPAYLERYSGPAKKWIEANPKADRPIAGLEVKKPGKGANWIRANSAAGMAVVREAAPAGTSVASIEP